MSVSIPMPDSSVSLADVLVTGELDDRPRRPPDFAAENRALVALAREMADTPKKLPQKLVDLAMELCRAGSAGISVPRTDAQGPYFYWQALAGACASQAGGRSAYDFSPCGTTLARGSPQLFSRPARYFQYLNAIDMPIVEGLVVPVYAKGEPLATIWIMSHDEGHGFDLEDTRLLQSLGELTGAALRTMSSLEAVTKAHEERDRFLKLSVDVLCVAGLDGHFKRVNSAFKKMLGYTRDELCGAPFIEFVHPEDRAATVTDFEKNKRGAPTEHFENRYRCKHGGYRWLAWTVSPVVDAGLLYAAAKDITERKRTEALQAGQTRVLELMTLGAPLAEVLEALVRTIEGQSSSGMLGSILLLDRDGVHLRHGAGPSLPEAYNRAIDGIAIGPVAGSCGTAAYRKEPVYVSDIAEDPLWKDFKELALTHNLRACWSTPIFSSRGSVLGTFAMYHREARHANEEDLRLVELVTRTGSIAIERKHAEKALRAREEELEIAIDVAKLGCWQLDLVTGALDCTTRCKTNYGLPHDAVFGYERLFELIHPEDRHRVRETVRQAIDGHTDYDAEYRIVWPHGRTHWIVARGRAFYGPKGEPASMIGVTQDITQRKRAEEALKDADRRKDEFLAILAHELRNPLAPLRTGLELMQRASDDRVKMERARGLMEQQVQHMVRLVDDLLDVSRISRGRIELHKSRIDLAAAAGNAAEAMRPAVEKLGHTLTVELPPEPIWLDGDTVRLAQVFSNLLDNAVKYTTERGQIRLSVKRRGREAVVAVKDSGVGIPADMLERIFEMFARVEHTVDQRQEGLGIGLMLVKRLVEMHEGRVQARSAGPGRGSQFIVRLPVAIGEQQRQSFDEHLEAANAVQRRVLVVDDNEAAAESLEMMLDVMGNEVQVAHDGLEALAVASSFRPEVVLLDIGMPKLGGHETARRMRAQQWGQGITLIAISGWGQERDVRLAREAGFDHHLTKPIAFEALEKLLADPRPAQA